MNIVILDGYTENPGDLSWDGFKAYGKLTVYDRTAFIDGNSEIVSRAKSAEILITNKTPISADTISALLPELKYIGILATGYNIVDVAAAKRAGIPVCNIPTYGTAAVAQFTMALLLEICHHAGEHSLSVKAGDWMRCPDFCYWKYPLVELAGKTMGLIGFGRIGRAVAKLAAAFGMTVLSCDPQSHYPELAKPVELDELLERSDVISLHCPLFDDTREIINESTISKMKRGVMLINTSRGPLINEAALCAALKSGRISYAALDVQTTEPPRKVSPLNALPNCILTPHIAWAPKESRQRLMNIAVDNVRAFIAGNPKNVVNF